MKRITDRWLFRASKGNEAQWRHLEDLKKALIQGLNEVRDELTAIRDGSTIPVGSMQIVTDNLSVTVTNAGGESVYIVR